MEHHYDPEDYVLCLNDFEGCKCVCGVRRCPLAIEAANKVKQEALVVINGHVQDHVFGLSETTE